MQDAFSYVTLAMTGTSFHRQVRAGRSVVEGCVAIPPYGRAAGQGRVQVRVACRSAPLLGQVRAGRRVEQVHAAGVHEQLRPLAFADPAVGVERHDQLGTRALRLQLALELGEPTL